VTLSARIGVALSASDVYIVVNGQQPATAGPRFWARNPGSWSAELSVSVTPTRRRAVAITAAANPTATEIQVASTAGFYTGAIVEVDNGSQQTYVVVAGVRAGGLLELTAALNMTVAPSASSNARIVEIDISIVDPSPAVPVAETFTQLSWNPDPSVRASHYATVINAQSQLVYVQPPGVGGLDGSEAATLPSQPTTFNGWPFSAASNAAALATTPAVPELNTLLQAAQALGPTVTAMPAGALPLLPADPLVIAVNGAATTLTGTLAAVTALGTGGSTALTTALSALTTAATAIVTAANGAVAQATTAPQTPATAAALATDVTTVTTDIAALPAAITAATTAVAGARSRAGAGAVTIGDDGSPPTAPDYVGLDNGPGLRSGIQALKDAESISIIAAPGRVEPEVQGELINQCELLRYRFAVLDGQQNPVGGSVNAIVAHRDQYDSSYAAYYVPWLQIALGNQSVFLPPSGHVAGIYAGTDNSRGVWKAPANVVVQNITGLKTYIVKGEQDILNPVGVNCIRRFDMLGTRVWGARTISSDDSLKYVNVRRTLIFLEASIDQGTQWVVFEPNNPDTWARVTDSVTAFLMTQWINGALFGVKPTDSFFVRCDLTTMTADDIQNGRLICLIGVAIVRPAEFVIFRIEQITGLPTQ
jgi:phage tail sheath protein FI